MFADDMAILSTSNSQLSAIDNLQRSNDNIFAWTRHWKIKNNGDKSIHVNYTLPKTENIQIVLNQSPIPQKDSAKSWYTFLGRELRFLFNFMAPKYLVAPLMSSGKLGSIL
jgi:hypothetical protein